MKIQHILFALFISLPLYAQEEVEEENQEEVAEEADNNKASKIGDEFEISADSVDFLKDSYKIGYGGIHHALVLAEKSGKTVDEILAMKTEDKMGWGKITKELGLKPGKDYRLDEDEIEAKLSKARGPEKKAEKMQAKMERAEARAEKKKNKNK